MNIKISSLIGRALCSFLLLSLVTPSGAVERSALFLGGDPALRGAVEKKLPDDIALLSAAMEVDYNRGFFVTNEKSRIAFSKLLHTGSLSDSPAVEQLKLEYNPDLIILAWIDKEEATENEAYGLSKHSITVRMRMIDVDSGQTLYNRYATSTTEFTVDESTKSKRDKARNKLIESTVARFGVKHLIAALGKHDQIDSNPKPIRIVFEKIGQQRYFEARDALMALVGKAGLDEIRDHFDPGKQQLTLRGTVSVSPGAFYRAFYSSAINDPAFDQFNINREGSRIVVEILPPEKRRLVVSGLDPERYHARLDAYRKGLNALEGVRSLGFEYLSDEDSENNRLIITFTYKGDLIALEEQLWRHLESLGETPNRDLASVSQNTIQYRVGAVSGERIALNITINNVGPGDYRQIGAPLDKIIKELGLADLKKEYDRNTYQLVYRFDTHLSPVDLDTQLWGAISKDSSLKGVVQDVTTPAQLGYFYQSPKRDQSRIAVAIKSLTPQAYGTAGRSLIAIISNISGVINLKHTYSEMDKTLDLRFGLINGDGYDVDTAIWEAVKQDPALSKLAMGELDENELEYFFSGERAAFNRDLIIELRGVTGKEYKKVATGFMDLLESVDGVRHARYRYQFKQRTVIFRLQYGGDSLFALDDALQRKMASNTLFESVSKGREVHGRLIFHVDRRIGSSAPTGGSGSGGNLGTDGALFESVAYLYVQSEEDGDSEGTAFFVHPSGYLLTNAHIVDKGRVYLRTYDGRQFRVRVIKSDPDQDLALIRAVTNTATFAPVSLGDSSDLSAGDEVTVIGNPLGSRFEHSLLKGNISGLNRVAGLIQLSIPAYPGVSGSPVFNNHGEVIGVMRAVALASKSQTIQVENNVKVVESVSAVENIGLAIPINYAKPLLQLALP